ncbi:hypothetical protein HYS90_01795 [Candidatus Curtissbacteria bacterium]|nr:hypothetical protein [Candidatus Curtissbacteria bacterium]
MDLTQIVLLAIIIVLAIALVVLGFQAFFALRDFRRALLRMNRLFNDTDELVGEIKKPIQRAGSLFTALTTGAGLIHLLKKGQKHERPKGQ